MLNKILKQEKKLKTLVFRKKTVNRKRKKELKKEKRCLPDGPLPNDIR
jgi:hypothetical protein